MFGLVAFTRPAVSESSQEPAPKRVETTEAKKHLGENATVCGKVVDAKVRNNGLAGYGLPGFYYFDEPEPRAVFYFIEFAPGPETGDTTKPDYLGKRLCVTGRIAASPSGVPYIMAKEHSQVKPETSK